MKITNTRIAKALGYIVEYGYEYKDFTKNTTKQVTKWSILKPEDGVKYRQTFRVKRDGGKWLPVKDYLSDSIFVESLVRSMGLTIRYASGTWTAMGVLSNIAHVHHDINLSKAVYGLLLKANAVVAKESTQCLHNSTRHMANHLNKAVKDKLLKAQVKYKLVDGWEYAPKGSPTGDGRFFITEEQCNIAFKNHVDKGDILDCVAYLGFMFAKGWKLDIS